VTKMGQVSAHAVRDIIIDRLASGAHPIGSKLPASRELAAEVGANRNTVAKAYQELATLGLVAVRQGRGTFVVAQPEHGSERPVALQLRNALTDVILKARRIGIPEVELRGFVSDQIDAAYEGTRRGAFVECNTADVDAAIDEIESLVGHRLSPLLLQRLVRDPSAATARLDVVFTSLFHVKEVSDCLAPTRPDVDVIGVYTQPDETALDRLARIPPGSRVGIVVSNAEGARRFANHINTVTMADTRALVLPSDEEIVALADEVDAFLCSRSRFRQVARLNLPQPAIELQFHVSRQSGARIAEALTGARMGGRVPGGVDATGRGPRPDEAWIGRGRLAITRKPVGAGDRRPSPHDSTRRREGP
jgi:DNA-binding transcriptional regulator YhcF (GntR family)